MEGIVVGGRPIRYEPDWLSGNLGGYKVAMKDLPPTSPDKPVQQGDLLKPLFKDIIEHGLEYAAKKWKDSIINPFPEFMQVKEKIKPAEHVFQADVIIIGAGMSGLVAAYELNRANVSVMVLEQTTRVGGKVFTLGEKDGLAKYLYGEAGAMRLPCKYTVPYTEMTHYLTDFYIHKFELPILEFLNESDNTWLSFYDKEKKRVTGKDGWTEADFNELWPGCYDNIHPSVKPKINNIDYYYSRTLAIVKDQLIKWLAAAQKSHNSNEIIKAEAKAWERWINIWSQFTLEGFLQSTYKAVLTKIKKEDDKVGLGGLQSLLPWPDIAVRGYSVYSYTQQLDQSLVQYLREELGHWWQPVMHRIDGGMSRLPEAFANSLPRYKTPSDPDDPLHRNIHFNHTVNEIRYSYHEGDPGSDYVEINGYFTSSKRPFPTVRGKVVIVTTPVNIIRQLTFKPINREEDQPKTPQPPKEFFQAIENIFTGPSTKIFIQTKTRFWEHGDRPIFGGFSKTNLPIGQLHYPSNKDGNLTGKTDKGLLLVYTWKTEALLFGALNSSTAVQEAVEQISTIHPEIVEQFELGLVHAWYNQPWTQGAYGVLKPNQFKNVQWLYSPMYNVFFGGEALSFTAGWIQGALESGLKAAFQYYIRYVEKLPSSIIPAHFPK